MQKFYKYFTLSVLSLTVIWFVSSLISNGAAQTVSAQQIKQQTEVCANQNVFPLEDTPARTVHLVYDFSRATVSIVQIQKGYNPPELTVRTRPLGQ